MSGKNAQPAKTLQYISVASKILELIQERSLQSGDRLDSERTLSKSLEVGRNTVREAIRVLENDGVLEVRAQKGIFIKTISIKQGGKDAYLDFMRHDYIELVEIKILLEQYAARRLLRRAQSKLLLRLEHLLWQMERQAKLGVYDKAADAAFHITIIKSHGNKMLVQYCENLTNELTDYAKMLNNDAAWIRTIPAHRQILDALLAGDEEILRDAYKQILTTDLEILNGIKSQDIVY